MNTVTIEIDSSIEHQLRRLGAVEGSTPEEVASRLLARAVRAARPRRVFDPGAIQTANAEFIAQDLALADSSAAERAGWLVREDEA